MLPSQQTICCGVPQESILGALVFLLYIIDLNDVSTVVELILFADDTNLFISHKVPVCLTASLDFEINKLSSLNLKERNFMLFKPGQKKVSFSNANMRKWTKNRTG